jgi:thiol-disulfide isomerase/thioredoxin
MAKSTKRQGDMRSLKLLITAFVLATLVSCSDSRQLFGGDNWTVINYWAVWCKPCREEIPELNHLNGVTGIEVLGVNFDRKSGEALYADAQSLGLEFENIGDPSHQLGIERPNCTAHHRRFITVGRCRGGAYRTANKGDDPCGDKT